MKSMHAGSGYQLYQEMCKSLQESGCSTEGMYSAYLLGKIRRLKNEVEKCQKK